MVAGSSPDGMPHGVRTTIRSIKEIVGDHSDSDIYAVLKETNMDPDETIQRLLDQDPFHEVRRRRDRKKENANLTSTNITKVQNKSRIERRIPNERRTEWKPNENRTEARQNEIRITNNTERKSDLKYNNYSESRNEWKSNGEISRTDHYNEQNEVRAEFVKTERVWDRNGYNYNNSYNNNYNNNYNYYNNNNNTRTVRGGYARTSRGDLARNPVPGHVKEYRIVRDNRNKPKSDEEQIPSPNPDSQILNSDQSNNSPKQEPTLPIEPIKSNSNIPKKESAAEICSSSDPVHHATEIRREVGVVGLRKPNPNPNPNSESRNSVQFQSNRGFNAENQRQYLRPNSRGNNRLNSQPVMNLNQYSGKSQQSNMEWRPKSSQSPRNELTLTGQSQQKQENVNNISSENLVKLKDSEDQHVIIPEHLRVSESEQTRLVFGSFDSPKKSTEGNNNNNNQNLLSSISVPPNEDLPSGTEQEITETQLRENANMQQGPSDESTLPQEDINENISNYESTLPHDLQDNSADLQNFKEFDPSVRYDMQFLSSSASQETTVLSTEAMSMGPSILPPPLQIPILTPQPLQNYQTTPHLQNYQTTPQQQIPHQMYPPPPAQLQLPQFANYLPYRHVFSPVYMPHQPMQNYQNAPGNTPYPPPPPQIQSPVPNYMMGAGTVGTPGVKYGTVGTNVNYLNKPVFNANGYGGNYLNNPNGYPGLIEDPSRMKYKDNNTIYAPNLQVEASDIWVQTPRELPVGNIQSAQFYQGQPGTPSYQASYSATQQGPQLQYSGMQQAGQPGSMTMLPPVGGHNLGAVGFQGGISQQHLGWTAGVNF